VNPGDPAGMCWPRLVTAKVDGTGQGRRPSSSWAGGSVRWLPAGLAVRLRGADESLAAGLFGRDKVPARLERRMESTRGGTT
jgi:hypothetical protein